ncbi:MAG: RluA family pseudouridine synthase [Chlamydiae bacterium]|nr:RluA family pseudouridine synthase [Chlamydiota bacterium]MBI3266118.1 RluA family pseudouridine synthase [Chlamydiota bacterium]
MSEEIVKTVRVDPADFDKRLDLYLVEKFPKMSRTQIQSLIKEGHVLIDGKLRKAHFLVKPGQGVEVCIPVPKKIELLPEDIPLEVLYEDEDILVINKQPGLVVHPAPGHREHTLVNAILHHCQQLATTDDPLRPGIVHRLDKDTSGCLIVAKREEGLRKVGVQFEKRKVMKQYLALVWGKMRSLKGELELAIGRHPVDRKKMAVIPTGKSAHTTFEVVEKFNEATLVKVFLKTGRTHQIRVHMAHLGHPVLGDEGYGKRGKELSEKIGISRQMLHAAQIGITHPVKNEWMLFTAPMPEDMKKAVERLKDSSVV